MASSLSEQFSGTESVQARHTFDEARLLAFFQAEVDSGISRLEVRQFRGGQSNPTFLIDAGDRRYVVRRKPPGDLLPSAHAVDREFRVMRALGDSDVPVPRTYALCRDPSVIGTDFFVMDYVDGRVLWDPRLPDLAATDRRAVYGELNRVIATLHDVDIETRGLTDYGRADGYIARQVARWTKQYRASETGRIAAMDELIAWLPQHVPPPSGVAIAHGDFRLDNMVFSHGKPEILAVLDWELSTIGDPMADFAYHCMAWRLPAELRGLGDWTPDLLATLGIPTEAEYLEMYCARRNLPVPDPQRWSYYMAFNLFRSAAIMQGIVARSLNGTASSAKTQQAAEHAKDLAARAWAQIADQSAGASARR